MPRASVFNPSPEWVHIKHILSQKSGRASGVYSSVSVPIKRLTFPVSLQATQKTKLRQKTSPQVSLASIFERLKELAQLEADWDSYGAEPISSVAFVTAFEVLEAAKELVSTKLKEPLPQFIAPLADGGLQLEWSGQRGDIEVEITPDGVLSYVLIEEQGTTRKFQEKHQVSLEVVLSLLSQFLSPEVKE